MLKRLFLIAGAATAVVMVRKKAQQQQAEQDLWNEATDTVSAPPAPVVPTDDQGTGTDPEGPAAS